MSEYKQPGYDYPYDDGYMNHAERVLRDLAQLPKHWRDLVLEKLPETVDWYEKHED